MKLGYLLQAGAPEVLSPPFSGPSIHVRQVIKELNNLDHSVRLIANQEGQTWKSDDLEKFEPVSVRSLETTPLRIFESAVRRIQSELRLPYAGLFESIRFASACTQELQGVDLLYERMGWMGYAGALAARRLGVPLVLEINGDSLSEMEALGVAPTGVQRWLSTKLTHLAITRSAHLVASGEGWRDRIMSRWGVDPEKITVIENGTELVDKLARHKLRAFAAHPDSSEIIKIVYIGGFQPWQGVMVLIRALSQVIAQGLPVHLLMFGTGPELPEVEKTVGEHHLERYITFLGHLPFEHLATYMADSDIGVSPYCGRDEFSGLKLLDYKAAGLAIIASGRDGKPSILTHGKNGWIVPPCDENALCEAIVHMISDADLRRRIGAEARIEAEQIHSWRNTAEQLIDLFYRIKTHKH